MHTLVFKSGATGHGHKFVGDGLAADGGLELLLADRFFLEEKHADFLVEVAHLIDQILVGFFREFLVVGGDFFNLISGALLAVFDINDGLLVENVELTLEIILAAQRDENRPGIGAEFVAHTVHGGVEVRAGAVHFVDESDAGHPVFAGLAPDRFRLRLHAGHAAEDGDGAVEHTQGTLNLGRKVHVAGCINNVHAHLEALVSLVDPLLLALHPRAGGGG